MRNGNRDAKGDGLKKERMARGTQAEIAAALGVHRVTISKWETGALKIPRMAHIALLALPKKERGKSMRKLSRDNHSTTGQSKWAQTGSTEQTTTYGTSGKTLSKVNSTKNLPS